ncbi:hypothetical protein [Methylomonas albis]|uniref:DNA-binding protein n=1 Tax=Methylomonas albis TaxID=1854563 RepID=A0ABR9D4L3_9GAMM|nr:hypothetical protein [Methylomonas albis]MBD9356812.1 hypothetical protein [Methylomonas albis]
MKIEENEVLSSNEKIESPYLTVELFNKKHPAFPVGTLRHYIFYQESNGLKKAGAIFKMGRKVLIKESAFFDWLESGAAAGKAA